MSTSSKNAQAVSAKTETVKSETQIPKSAAPPTQAEPKAQTIEKTIETQKERARQLQHLFEKRQKLTETREELEEFTLSNNGQTNKLSLTDGKGVTFNTYNPAVIEQVHKLVLTITAQQLEETEKQILLL